MHRGNDSAYPSPSLNHNRLADRSLDISPAVLPSSIARQPRLPYTRLSLFARVDASPAGAIFTNHAPRRQRPRRPPAGDPEPARTEIAPARTQPPALVARSSGSLAQIARDATVRSGRVCAMWVPRLARTVSSQLLPLPNLGQRRLCHHHQLCPRN
ncbi:hypothetical protein EDB83DRAFT_439749 [Lactarius deliciosus]|nr:hypothetical protein EDB83DRAFT_439749 [Lactarius deliciosus]